LGKQKFTSQFLNKNLYLIGRGTKNGKNFLESPANDGQIFYFFGGWGSDTGV
jgi:hypothetical protein